MNKLPLEIHSDYSIQESFCRIPELVQYANDHDMPYICLTDTHSVSGAVELFQEVEKINKKRTNKIIPVIGASIRILKDEIFEYVTVLAQDKLGWQSLLKILNHNAVHNDLLYSTREKILAHTDGLILVLNIDQESDLSQHFKNTIINSAHPVYYISKEDVIYQRLILCSKHKKTKAEIETNPAILAEDGKFFISDEYHIPDSKEWDYDKDILSLVKSYSIASQPNIPVYTEDPNTLLTNLCREGWRNKKLNDKLQDPGIKESYVARIKEELAVLTSAGLANYMLIVRDIMNFCHEHDVRVGLRGSATGCLVSYLIDISDLDPMQPDPTVPYDPAKELLFERFFNAGRLSADRVSLPDCDIDVEPWFREQIFEYLRTKYGLEKSGHIMTFLRMDGRSALKEVFRILQPVANSVNIADDITKNMVDTSKVQDILADIQEEDPNYTIIHFNIDNNDKIRGYYYEYKDIFEKAIKLTNLIRTTGKHAAGIVIANQPLDNFIPVAYDTESGQATVALEMADAEYVGAVKFDILGVAAYEKISKIMDMVKNGRSSVKIQQS